MRVSIHKLEVTVIGKDKQNVNIIIDGNIIKQIAKFK